MQTDDASSAGAQSVSHGDEIGGVWIVVGGERSSMDTHTGKTDRAIMAGEDPSKVRSIDLPLLAGEIVPTPGGFFERFFGELDMSIEKEDIETAEVPG